MIRKTANHIFPFYKDITVCSYLTLHARPFASRVHSVIVTQTRNAVEAASLQRQPGAEHLRAAALPPHPGRGRDSRPSAGLTCVQRESRCDQQRCQQRQWVPSPCCFCASLLACFPPLSCWGERRLTKAVSPVSGTSVQTRPGKHCSRPELSVGGRREACGVLLPQAVTWLVWG